MRKHSKESPDPCHHRKSVKTHCMGNKNHFVGLIRSEEWRSYIRDMCNVLVTSHPPFYLQIQQEFQFLANPLIALRITRFRVRVNDTFVKDEAMLFDAWNHFDTFLFKISLKIIRGHHLSGAAMVQRVLQFSQNIVFHGLKIQESCTRTLRVNPRSLHITLPCRVV